MTGTLLRVRGAVQGVGLRPAVARIARTLELSGYVKNDGEGLLIGLVADTETQKRFVAALMSHLPRMARVDVIEPLAMDSTVQHQLAQQHGFHIEQSDAGVPHTDIPPDAALCPACRDEVLSPYSRRFRYPFVSCSECGPRFSLTRAIPFDRNHTAMADFPLCPTCSAEYVDSGDRRFHAQVTACHECGPRATLVRADGRPFDYTRYTMLDEVDAAGSLLLAGEIVALKGLGGFHLCCDATNEKAVQLLRERKRRPHRPLSLMFRDLEVMGRYVVLSPQEEALLTGAASPIVLLPRRDMGVGSGGQTGYPQICPSVAPAQRTFGCMLPYTALHQLLLLRVDRPIVCTSGNLTDAPPCMDEQEARDRLGGIASWFLLHNRPIEHRVDDSVVAVMGGQPRVLRRARGYAPESFALPAGFEHSPALLAMGTDLKSAFVMTQDGRAVMSSYLGNLDDHQALEAYQGSLEGFSKLYQHAPRAVVVDAHPSSRAAEIGHSLAEAQQLPFIRVQHHHAHIAACMAENRYPKDAGAVLGIALDGLGYGDEGGLWGGEFMLANYGGYRRVGTLKPIRLLGGDRASREPWRCLYAHLRAAMGWSELHSNFGDLEVIQNLWSRPVNLLDQMMETGLSAPWVTSAGRLFDAVAAALDLFRDGVSHEAQAAMALEALVTPAHLQDPGEPYGFSIMRLPHGPHGGLPYLEPLGMWRSLLSDLWAGVHRGLIAARFHRGLAAGIARMVERLRDEAEVGSFDTVALSGGVFQNRVLFELVDEGLQALGFNVLAHRHLPPNDGCIALGQATIAATQLAALSP